jgi:predicted Zn-dependent protease
MGAAVAVVEVVVVAGAVQHVIRVLRRLTVDADRVGAERIGGNRRGDAGQQAEVRGRSRLLVWKTRIEPVDEDVGVNECGHGRRVPGASSRVIASE